MYKLRVGLFLGMLLCCAALNENQSADNGIRPVYKGETATAYTEIVPVRFNWNKYTIIATATAAVLVVVGIAASASLLLPLITYNICYLFGACNYSLESDVADRLEVNGNVNSRQRRSVEYLGPIIQTLAAAYEKYGDQQEDGKKNLPIPNFYTR